MGFEETNRSVDNDEDKNGKVRQPKKVVHTFYFAKINRLFIDRDLKASVSSAKISEQQLMMERTRLFATDIQPLKAELESAEKEMRRVQSNHQSAVWAKHWAFRHVEHLQLALEKHWPESIDENVQELPDPDVVATEIKEKTPRLTKRFGHGNITFAEEKRKLKELDRLYQRRQKCDSEVKEAEAKIPRPQKRYEYWHYGSKYDLKRQIRSALEDLKKCEEKEKAARIVDDQKQNQIIADIKIQIVAFENKSNGLKQEEERASELVAELRMRMRKQAAIYENYCTLLNKAKMLASRKDLKSLENLSHKEVDEFMSKWTSDDTFRANYTRSIRLSLADRGLSRDGRSKDAVV